MWFSFRSFFYILYVGSTESQIVSIWGSQFPLGHYHFTSKHSTLCAKIVMGSLALELTNTQASSNLRFGLDKLHRESSTAMMVG